MEKLKRTRILGQPRSIIETTRRTKKTSSTKQRKHCKTAIRKESTSKPSKKFIIRIRQ